MEFNLTPEQLGILAGAVLSLLFSYVPGLKLWYAMLGVNPDGSDDEGVRKRLVMAGISLLVALAVFGLACGQVITSGVTCDRAGVVQLTFVYVSVLIGNQSIYAITPQTKVVRDAKKARARADLSLGRG